MRPTPQVPLDPKAPADLPRRERLRVLIMPLIGLRQIQGDSSYRGAIDTARYNPAHFFYIALPAVCRGFETPLPNVKHVFYDMPNDFFAADCAVSLELAKDFSRRLGRFVVDVVLAHRTASAGHIATALSDFRRPDPVPVILFEGGVWPFPFACEADNYSRGWAYAACYCGFHSDYDRKFAAEFVAYACSANAVERFWRHSFIDPVGLDLEAIDRLRKATPKHEKPTVFVGSRFNPSKNTLYVFETLDWLFKMGADFPLVCTTPTSKIKGTLYVPEECFSWVRNIQWECPRDAYMQEAVRCHVMITAEVDTAFPAFLVEQLLLGVVPIVPGEKEWPFIVLPADYPFVYRSQEEALAWLKWCLEHYQAAWARVQPAVEQARARFDARVTIPALGRRMVDIVNRGRTADGFVSEWTGVGGAVSAALRKLGKDRFTWAEFRRLLNRNLSGMAFPKVGAERRKIPRASQPTAWDIREVLHKMGYVDTCRSPYPVFENLKEGDNPDAL